MGLETVIIAGTLAALSGGMAVMDAQQANKDAKRNEEAQLKAITAEQKQVAAQAELEKAKTINRANAIQSRIRVAAGESGIGLGATYNALQRQTEYDATINNRIADLNAMAQINSLASQYQKQPRQNILLQGISGLMSGAQSGLSISNSVKSTKTTTPK